MADREAALCKINAKEEEFARKEALLEEGKARATAEAQEKVWTCSYCVFIPSVDHAVYPTDQLGRLAETERSSPGSCVCLLIASTALAS